MIGCAGHPTFVYATTESWPINGARVQFATYGFDAKQLLVIYADRSYVSVDNIGMFSAASANEANVLALVASNPTHC